MAVQFASRLALIAFATVAVRGVIIGADFEGCLQAALVALAVFYGIGLIFGELARRLVEENVQAEFTRTQTEHAMRESPKGGAARPDPA